MSTKEYAARMKTINGYNFEMKVFLAPEFTAASAQCVTTLLQN